MTIEVSDRHKLVGQSRNLRTEPLYRIFPEAALPESDRLHTTTKLRKRANRVYWYNTDIHCFRARPYGGPFGSNGRQKTISPGLNHLLDLLGRHTVLRLHFRGNLLVPETVCFCPLLAFGFPVMGIITGKRSCIQI